MLRSVFVVDDDPKILSTARRAREVEATARLLEKLEIRSTAELARLLDGVPPEGAP